MVTVISRIRNYFKMRIFVTFLKIDDRKNFNLRYLLLAFFLGFPRKIFNKRKYNERKSQVTNGKLSRMKTKMRRKEEAKDRLLSLRFVFFMVLLAG